MSHARQTIRQAIATLLAPTGGTYGTVIQTRIASTRQQWPYVMVFADNDNSEPILISEPNTYDRILSISIVGMLRMPGNNDTETIEDRMDAMAEEIEGKLTNADLRATVPRIQFITLISTDMNVIIQDDDKIDHAELLQSWQVGYATVEGVPGTLV
jgi:hypothetical protein